MSSIECGKSDTVSGFGTGKECACRGQQRIWCQVFHILQEAEHLQLRVWRFGPSPVYDAEHNQRRAHSSLTNKLFSRLLWVGDQILPASEDSKRSRWQRFRPNREVLPVTCQENAGRRPKASQEESFTYNIPGICDISLLEESSTSIWRLFRDFWIVGASQLWLVSFLRTSLDVCTVSRVHMIDGRDRVECLFFFFLCPCSEVSATQCAPFISYRQHQFEVFLSIKELRFNDTRRKKTPICVDTRHLHDSLSMFHLLESADQIRLLSHRVQLTIVSIIALHKLCSSSAEVIWFLVSALLRNEYDTYRLIDWYYIFIRWEITRNDFK